MIDAVLATRPESAPARRNVMPAAVLRVASDERLVELVRGGSEQAFEAFFERHHPQVLVFCRHMLGSPEDAEDVVQQTFLAAYHDLVRSGAPVAPRSWLYAIARHRCLTVLRARPRRPVSDLPESGTDHVSAEIAARDDLRALVSDMRRLPDDQRTALVLAELGGVSHEQIALILACRREKVKALVYQARSSLSVGRAARETPCAEIREQLSRPRGGALRRATLRRHLHDCPGCRAFRDDLRVRGRRLGLLLPVSFSGWLRRAVVGALFGPGGAGTEGAAVTAGALSGGGLAATVLVTVAIPISGIAAVVGASVAGGEAARTSRPPIHLSTAKVAAPESASPRTLRAGPVRSPRAAERPGTSAGTNGRTQTHERPSEAQPNGDDTPPVARQQSEGDHGEHVSAPRPSKPSGVPKTFEPAATDSGDTHANPAPPTKRPKPSGQVTPTRPSESKSAHGQVTPAKPAEPARGNGQVMPGKPAERVTHPPGNDAATPPRADGHPETPSAAAPAPAPAHAGEAPLTFPATPGNTGPDRDGEQREPGGPPR